MTVSTQKVYVFRHGATEWSDAGKHTGLTDVPLTEEGRRNAARLRPYLSSLSFSRVLTSPLQRARHTCELAGLCADAEESADLLEWNYGDYEGLTSKQIHRQRSDWMVFTDGAPNGETPNDVAARVNRVISKLRRLEGNVAIFAHGHVLRVFAARWLNLRPGAGRYFVLDTATVSCLGHYHDSPAILTWNAALSSDGTP
jgi:broad specificity phosphatase PhoE